MRRWTTPAPPCQHSRIRRLRNRRRHQADAGGEFRPRARARRDHRTEALPLRPHLPVAEGRGGEAGIGDLEDRGRRRLSIKPENGIEVIATGRIEHLCGPSKYQLVIDRLEYAGEGALLARIEMLRKRLLAEGLFAAERKRPLPMLPRIIGVVSSERRRGDPGHPHHHPAPLPPPHPAVAGGGAGRRARPSRSPPPSAASLPAGGAEPRPDVIIVARGGGSLEDLMAFNEEVVVRAAADSPIPLISRRRPRDRHHADRLRLRPPRADPDRRRRDGGAGARRPAGRTWRRPRRGCGASAGGAGRAGRPAAAAGTRACPTCRRALRHARWLDAASG